MIITYAHEIYVWSLLLVFSYFQFRFISGVRTVPSLLDNHGSLHTNAISGVIAAPGVIDARTAWGGWNGLHGWNSGLGWNTGLLRSGWNGAWAGSPWTGAWAGSPWNGALHGARTIW